MACWSRPPATVGWMAAGLIWLIQARGGWDKLNLMTSGTPKRLSKRRDSIHNFPCHLVSNRPQSNANKQTNKHPHICKVVCVLDLLHYSSQVHTEDAHFCLTCVLWMFTSLVFRWVIQMLLQTSLWNHKNVLCAWLFKSQLCFCLFASWAGSILCVMCRLLFYSHGHHSSRRWSSWLIT